MRNLAIVLLAVGLAACGSSPKPAARVSPSPSLASPDPTPSFVTATCAPGAKIEVVAEKSRYSTECIAVRSGVAFTIAFKNRDEGRSHNMVISQDLDATHVVFRGKTTIGKEDAVYEVPPVAKARYFYRCEFHPGLMRGTLIAV